MIRPPRTPTWFRVATGFMAFLTARQCWRYPKGALYGAPADVVTPRSHFTPDELHFRALSYTSPEQAMALAVASGLLALGFLWLALRPVR